jgi:REP element-mobilizing transposase RayT
MATARKIVLLPEAAAVYHCVSRCVRRAFLCGYDTYARRDYEHRRHWVRRRVQDLSAIFAVQVCAYAVMANHVHLVLHCDPLAPRGWSDEEVARRWCRLFPAGLDAQGRPLPPDEDYLRSLLANARKLAQCRERLGNLSWFMRCLNEHIARRANHEDACTGRFWEGRFKCQRLADAGAILTCMAYVDLNPVRAALADRPELCEFTSICDRIAAEQARVELAAVAKQADGERSEEAREAILGLQARARRDQWLRPLEGIFGQGAGGALGVSLEQYLELVDWTGRSLRQDRQGAIPGELAGILERLGVEQERWCASVEGYGGLFARVAGHWLRIREAAQQAGLRWLHGLRGSRLLYCRAMPAP